ncbi:MAG TPA: uracil-DNA glycosylase [bacterium]|nr:uracil-DNA glycosylase [bacterium]
MSASWVELNRRIVACRLCPRLVAWREEVARLRKPAFADQVYWGKPLAGFGDPDAGLWVLGLAPAAHGGNRTGRIFTGDRSGDWLFRALHRAGFANQPTSVARDDGLKLEGAFISAAVRCAPPGNQPTPEERDRCFPFLGKELVMLKNLKALVALGAFAWQAALRLLKTAGWEKKPQPAFGHGKEVSLGPYVLLGSFHPSQQNTFTGKLTEAMLDAVFERARAILQRGLE